MEYATSVLLTAVRDLLPYDDPRDPIYVPAPHALRESVLAILAMHPEAYGTRPAIDAIGCPVCGQLVQCADPNPHACPHPDTGNA